jgi:putative transposase
MYRQKRFNRKNVDQTIEDEMLKIRQQHKDYGYLRITQELRHRGFLVNKKKVQRLIRKLDIRVETYTRKSRKYSSYKGKVGTVAKNLIRRRFSTTISHQKITTDTTEFKYFKTDTSGIVQTKKLYLNPFIDMFNSEVLSYRISRKPNVSMVLEGLEEAITITNNCPYRRTFHSDQGWIYQMRAYTDKLETNHIFQSMSRKGNCLDNALMESFFSQLKQEIFYGKNYHSFKELKSAIDNYIQYYNNERIKRKLNYLSPVEFRKASQIMAY